MHDQHKRHKVTGKRISGRLRMKLKTFTTLDVALIHQAATQQGGAAANQKAVLGVGVLLLLLLHNNRPVYHLTGRGSPWSVTRLSGVSPRRRVGALWVRAGLRWGVSTRLGVGRALVLTCVFVGKKLSCVIRINTLKKIFFYNF